MTVSNQDVKKKSFIHKIFTTKEKEGSSSSDFSAPLQALEVFAQIGAQKKPTIVTNAERQRTTSFVVAYTKNGDRLWSPYYFASSENDGKNCKDGLMKLFAIPLQGLSNNQAESKSKAEKSKQKQK
ncbi:hypothetical protein ACFX1Z_022602 [Malus domestica]